MIEGLDIAAVFEEYQPQIWRYVLARCGDPTLADHIAADVFVNLLEQIAKGKGPHTNIRSYLYQAALHELIDHSRADQRLAPIDLAEGKSSLGADRSEIMPLLGPIMKAHLTDQQSEVILLRFIQDRSIKETAEVTGLTENNVKVIQSRAMPKLKAALAAQLQEQKGFRMNFDLKDSILVPLKDIEDNPYQARDEYDQITLVGLAASIKELGLLQIPIARQVGEKYQLAFGHQRRKAFEMLYREGLKTYAQMPLYVREISDQEMFEISLSENLKRRELNPIEKATALRRYMDDFKASSSQAAKLFGMPASSVRQMVRYLNLPEDAQQELSSGKMSMTRARELLAKPGKKKQTGMPDAIIEVDGTGLRERLLFLLYGLPIRSDVSDDALISKVKELVNENKQLRRQVDVMNRHSRDISKLSNSTKSSSAALVETGGTR